jgi:hypothetical protein
VTDRTKFVREDGAGDGKFGQRPSHVLTTSLSNPDESRGQKPNNGQKPNESLIPVLPAPPPPPPPPAKK